MSGRDPRSRDFAGPMVSSREDAFEILGDWVREAQEGGVISEAERDTLLQLTASGDSALVHAGPQGADRMSQLGELVFDAFAVAASLETLGAPKKQIELSRVGGLGFEERIRFLDWRRIHDYAETREAYPGGSQSRSRVSCS